MVCRCKAHVCGGRLIYIWVGTRNGQLTLLALALCKLLLVSRIWVGGMAMQWDTVPQLVIPEVTDFQAKSCHYFWCYKYELKNIPNQRSLEHIPCMLALHPICILHCIELQCVDDLYLHIPLNYCAQRRLVTYSNQSAFSIGCNTRPRNPGQADESAKTIHCIWCAIIKYTFHRYRDQPPLYYAHEQKAHGLQLVGVANKNSICDTRGPCQMI